MEAEIEAARADLTTRSFFLFFNSQAALVSRSMTKRLRDGVGRIQGSFQSELHRCSITSAAIHTYSRCEINTTTSFTKIRNLTQLIDTFQTFLSWRILI
jgi:hypothetical protein